MGPFEKKVDNGLENRKLAFDLILSLLNEYGLVLDKQIVMGAVLKGLEDTSIEVQLLCHQLLTHLETLDSSIIKLSAKEISGPLRKSIFRKTKDTATKQEIEDSQDLIRSSLGLSVIVNNLSPMDPAWTLLISEIKKARDEQKTLVGVELNDYFPL